MTTGLVWDERFFWYDFGDYRSLLGGHPWLQPGSFRMLMERWSGGQICATLPSSPSFRAACRMLFSNELIG